MYIGLVWHIRLKTMQQSMSVILYKSQFSINFDLKRLLQKVQDEWFIDPPFSQVVHNLDNGTIRG
jgi:hypothetical protein